MSGLENMKRQILDEANHSAEEQISKARTKAEEILREAREQMEEQSAVMAKKSEDETKDYAQRIASSSEMSVDFRFSDASSSFLSDSSKLLFFSAIPLILSEFRDACFSAAA